MTCPGSGPVQSRCGGAGLRDWYCSGCQAWIAGVPFDEEGAGQVPDHEPGRVRAPEPPPEPAAPPDPEPTPEPVKKPRRPIDY